MDLSVCSKTDGLLKGHILISRMQFMLEAARKQRVYAARRQAWRYHIGDYRKSIGRGKLSAQTGSTPTDP